MRVVVTFAGATQNRLLGSTETYEVTAIRCESAALYLMEGDGLIEAFAPGTWLYCRHDDEQSESV